MTRLDKLQAMLADSPEDEFLNYALAMEFVSSGRDEDAINGFARVRQLSPQHSAACFQQSQILARLGRLDEARAAATAGVAAARAQGDQHAVEEISGFLDSLS
jgi:predicted Zn-dependent protease